MSEQSATAELSAEDRKLLTMARSARARINAIEGAAVRDGDGRTYTGVSVRLPALSISALHLAVASAVAAGATTLEAALVVTEASKVDPGDLAAVSDVTTGIPVYLATPDGTIAATGTA
ncbi:cytidine deaminase [Catellatospora sp. KI3]|uniref:cytidine deaminase n=1 Tax=Catellatospora sp. KI3 TaxID=3041620 RepID=UPI002482C795|nr:cytidine deaminase [Catellatospora sp. KI3]MDI1465588.1 cytidine deaminase [Catellatospora sp. KI3]